MVHGGQQRFQHTAGDLPVQCVLRALPGCSFGGKAELKPAFSRVGAEYQYFGGDGLMKKTVAAFVDGGLQIVLVLLACVASGACAIVGRRMQAPSPMDQGGAVAARTVLAVVCYILGIVCMLAMLFGLAAVFAPLIGLAH